MAEKRSLRAALVVRPATLWSGAPAGEHVRVQGGAGEIPIRKSDGSFVFTGTAPEKIIITSEIFQDDVLEPEGYIIRPFLAPRPERWEQGCASCRLELEPYEKVHLCRSGFSQALTLDAPVNKGDTEISLYKTDYRDITCQYHVTITSSGDFGEPFLIMGHRGHGVYTLEKAFIRSCEVALFRIAPLFTLRADCRGGMIFPIPGKCPDELAIFRKAGVVKIPVEAGKMNHYNKKGGR